MIRRALSPCCCDEVVSVDAGARLGVFLVGTPTARVHQLALRLVLLGIHDVIAVSRQCRTRCIDKRLRQTVL